MVSVNPPIDRGRIGWWIFVLVLALAAAFIAYSFIGILVFGVFGYYATRRICRRVAESIDSDGIAALVTVLLILVPVVVLLFYAGFRIFQQVQQYLGGSAQVPVLEPYLEVLSDEQRETLLSVVQNPTQLLSDPGGTAQTVIESGLAISSAIVGALIVVGLAITLTFFLLKNDDALAEGLLTLLGGRETTAYAYASAVDQDLESVFFGNFLFVVAMSIVAAAAYWTTNALAPEDLRIPMLFVLAVLTGIASLLPVVVGKVVYLPVVGYLAVQAVRTDPGALPFVGGVLVAYFLLLDILPQTFLQPYITGREIDVTVLMFGYLLGPILFGWYGFFLLPIVFVLMLEVVRIVLPELVRGEPLTPSVSMGESIGSTPHSPETTGPEDDVSDGSSSGGESREPKSG